jgi:hypothetical protein
MAAGPVARAAVCSKGVDMAGLSNAAQRAAPDQTSRLPTMSAFVQILLQKSFWGGARKFLEPLMRFMRDDVRDHIVSSKIDHGPP